MKSLKLIISSTSEIRVEQRLNILAEEHRQGYHEASVLSAQTIDSLSADDKLTWREIRKKLENIGISVAAFDANQDFILNWLSHAIESGAFDDSVPSGVVEGIGPRSMSRPLLAPIQSPIEPPEPTTAESSADVDLATDVSRRDDMFPWTIPEDGGTITIPVKERRDRQEGGAENRLTKASNQSQTSLLIENLEAGKVSVTPSAALASKAEAPKETRHPASLQMSVTQARNPRLPQSKIRPQSMETINGIASLVGTSAPPQELLFNCIRGRDARGALEIIDNGAQMSYLVQENISDALLAAVRSKLPSVVEALVIKGPDLNVLRTEERPSSNSFRTYTLLSEALNTPEILDILLRYGANPNVRLQSRNYHSTVLHIAARDGFPDAVHRLVTHGMNVDMPSSIGSPLMLAVAGSKSGACADLLVSLGADVNYAQDARALSRSVLCPLDAAIIAASRCGVKFLLNHGAFVSSADISKAMALRNGHAKNIPQVYFPKKLTANPARRLLRQEIYKQTAIETEMDAILTLLQDAVKRRLDAVKRRLTNIRAYDGGGSAYRC